MAANITNADFIDILGSFYDNTREKGSVWITIKRVPASSNVERRPYACQVRAKIERGKHHPSSICTQVSPNNIVQFSNQITGLMKHKCTNLNYEE